MFNKKTHVEIVSCWIASKVGGLTNTNISISIIILKIVSNFSVSEVMKISLLFQIYLIK